MKQYVCSSSIIPDLYIDIDTRDDNGNRIEDLWNSYQSIWLNFTETIFNLHTNDKPIIFIRKLSFR